MPASLKRSAGFKIDELTHIARVRCSGKEAHYVPTAGLHRHSHHEILIIKKGGGEHVIDYITYPVKDNQVFFLRPGQVHEFKPDKDAVFYFVAMDGNAISINTTVQLSQFEFFQSFRTQGYIILDTVDPLITLIKTIEAELNSAEPKLNQNTLICSYLAILFITLQRELIHSIKKDTRESLSGIVTEFNRLIDDAQIKNRFVHQYANRLYVSANYLNERVKNETGKPASYWINQKILLEAKRLLKQTRRSLSEVARELEFKDATHFSRFFKTHVGLTPRQFRGSYSNAGGIG